MSAGYRHVALATGSVLVGAFVLLALAAGVGVFDQALAIEVGQRLLPPSAAHWLGTDALGRDVVALIASGARTSLGVALASVTIGVAAGVPLGALVVSHMAWDIWIFLVQPTGEITPIAPLGSVAAA